MSEIPELDTAAISAAYERRVSAACPAHLRLALEVRERLDPERWALEWHLPWWLGYAFGLERETCSDLVLSNVLGLASIRLRDDLIDGEIDPRAVADARLVSDALYEAALDVYRAAFPGSSSLWGRLDSFMADWQAAASNNAEPGHDPAMDDGMLRLLARRGAPLKISAYAVCLLADRTDHAFAMLEHCLDHALAAMVLYDHFCDWQADLAAGRWNAFVAGATTYPQVPDSRERIRATVLVAMISRRSIETHFAPIKSELEHATMISRQLGVVGLTDHIAGLTTQLDEQATTMQARFGQLGERATSLVFGDRPPFAARKPFLEQAKRRRWTDDGPGERVRPAIPDKRGYVAGRAGRGI